MKMLCACAASVSVNAEKQQCDVYARVFEANSAFEFPLAKVAKQRRQEARVIAEAVG